MDRLSALLQKYNSGAHDLDQVLMELAKRLDKEMQRAAKENLSEEELARSKNC